MCRVCRCGGVMPGLDINIRGTIVKWADSDVVRMKKLIKTNIADARS